MSHDTFGYKYAENCYKQSEPVLKSMLVYEPVQPDT